jgi:hypothetical protein
MAVWRDKFFQVFGVYIDEYYANYEEAFQFLSGGDEQPKKWDVLVKSAQRGYIPIIDHHLAENDGDNLIEEVLYTLIIENQQIGLERLITRMEEHLVEVGAPWHLYYEDINASRLLRASNNVVIINILKRVFS